MELISLDIHERRKILIQMLDYSSFGGDDRQSEGLQGQIKYDHSDLSHSSHSNLSNTISDSNTTSGSRE